MIKDGVQLMRLQLPFLDEVHNARDARERERAIRDHRHRGVEFQPRIYRHPYRMPDIDRREQREPLNEQGQRRRERTHKRKPVGRSDQQINQRERPGQENEYFEQVRDRTTPERVSANRKKSALKCEPKRDREKIKATRSEHAFAQGGQSMSHRDQETQSGSKKKLPFHRERSV